ncbi:hypothetical protein TNIN_85781 [Trichonephila inaurata madagascariensis]|uniref:Uncharacterized protein n=1 Tax=Trichonephila inaurata madagascariensis TaxID=2747483 RepID=A0A8X7CKB7_9ARAC|nr:hypothetical protein TNIN_85781 [Trichonephila inaurata madagascariensis]
MEDEKAFQLNLAVYQRADRANYLKFFIVFRSILISLVPSDVIPFGTEAPSLIPSTFFGSNTIVIWNLATCTVITWRRRPPREKGRSCKPYGHFVLRSDRTICRTRLGQSMVPKLYPPGSNSPNCVG